MISRARVPIALTLALAASAAHAQNVPPAIAAAADPNPSYLTPQPLRADNPLLQKTKDYQGIALSDWMFFPEFLAQGVYNDNLALSSTNRRSAAGVELTPDVYAVRDTGVSKTEAYAAADAYLYPTAPRDNLYNGTIGVAQIDSPRPDLTIKAQAGVERLGGFAAGGEVLGPNGAPTPLVAPLQYNRATASTAVQKGFGRYFLGVSLSEAATSYDALATAVGSLSQTYRNSSVTTLTERGGYWVSPLLYSYVETAENLRAYADSALRSQGWRAVAGLGTDRFSLFRGEIYAGWQSQSYSPPLPGTASSPVIGTTIYYYPTRALTLTAAVDQTFTDSSNPTPLNPRGNPARDLSAKLDATYALHRSWWATAEGRVDRAYYLGSPRIDTTYIASGRIDYQLMRNLDIAASYTFVKVNSNALDGSYSDNVASLGGLYKF